MCSFSADRESNHTNCYINYEMIRHFAMPPLFPLSETDKTRPCWYKWRVVAGFCLVHLLLYTNHKALKQNSQATNDVNKMGRAKRIWYLSPMRAAKVQANLRIRAVSPEPPLLAHTSSESRGTFRQKARSLAPLNGWACAVEICHDGMLEDTNSLDAAQMILLSNIKYVSQRASCLNLPGWVHNESGEVGLALHRLIHVLNL